MSVFILVRVVVILLIVKHVFTCSYYIVDMNWFVLLGKRANQIAGERGEGSTNNNMTDHPTQTKGSKSIWRRGHFV